MKYTVEREASLRGYEFYNDQGNGGDAGIVARGVSLSVRAKDEEGEEYVPLLELQKVILSDDLLRFILSTFKGKFRPRRRGNV